jgi:hypothetical protein
LTSVAWAQDLVNSPHDLSTGSTSTLHTDAAGVGTDQTCVFCHAPHDAIAATYGPLWNRNYVPGAITTYTSATFDGGAIALGPQSYACLSCHDGTLALDNLVNTPGSGTVPWVAGGIYDFVDTNGRLNADNELVNGPAAIGTDLSNDHPVGFVYATSETNDSEINPIPAWAPLYATQMECATCHNVHDYDGGGAGVNGGYTMFLRQSTTQSQICTDCHLK